MKDLKQVARLDYQYRHYCQRCGAMLLESAGVGQWIRPHEASATCSRNCSEPRSADRRWAEEEFGEALVDLMAKGTQPPPEGLGAAELRLREAWELLKIA